MKNLLKAAVVLATFTSGVAHANTINTATQQFDFSYQFASNDVITGSLMGNFDTTGTYVENIANIQVSFDGVQFQAPIVATAWNTAITNFDDTIAPIVSVNAALNNFAFADVDVAVNSNWSNGFVFVNDPNLIAAGYNASQLVFATDINTTPNLNALDNPSTGTWALTAVPVPGALPMMLSGLGLLAAAGRRRIQA